MDYDRSKNQRAENYSNKSFNINYGMHKIYPEAKTIIGRYCNKDNKEFDLFRIFDSKCPSCDSKILEGSCYKCCHNEGCGKVNYFMLDSPVFSISFSYNRWNDYFDSISGKNSALLSEVFEKGLKHHMCNNCGYEYFTITGYY